VARGLAPSEREAEEGARAAELLGSLAGVLGRVFSRLGWGGGVPVVLEAEVPEDMVLVVHVDEGSVSLSNSDGERLRLRGRARKPEDIVFRLVEAGEGRLEGHLYLRRGSFTVEAPFSALVVEADAAAAKIVSERPLRRIGLSLDAAASAVEATLEPGGGLRAELDAAALKAVLRPGGRGEYLVEVVADSSTARIEVPGEKEVIVEDRAARYSTVKVVEGRSGAPVRVRARVHAVASTVKLL